MVNKLFLYCKKGLHSPTHKKALSKTTDSYFSNHENVNSLGQVNAGMKNIALKDFCNWYFPTSLINQRKLNITVLNIFKL